MGENKYAPRGLCYTAREPSLITLCRREDTGILLEGKEIWHVPLQLKAEVVLLGRLLSLAFTTTKSGFFDAQWPAACSEFFFMLNLV